VHKIAKIVPMIDRQGQRYDITRAKLGDSEKGAWTRDSRFICGVAKEGRDKRGYFGGHLVS
jgi:hypothetical protein